MVIRFDNRDCGLSTQARRSGRATAGRDGRDRQRWASHRRCRTRLSDMAADAIGLLDHLGIDRAHIVGASMGGMIVQTIAIEHPDRVASLTSIMSTPGDRSVGQPTPEAMAVLLSAAADRARGVHRGVGAAWLVFAVQEVLRRSIAPGAPRRCVRPSVLPRGRCRGSWPRSTPAATAPSAARAATSRRS